MVEDEGQADGETHDGESLGADGERQNLDGVGDQQGGIGDIVEGVVEELRKQPMSVSYDAGRREKEASATHNHDDRKVGSDFRARILEDCRSDGPSNEDYKRPNPYEHPLLRTQNKVHHAERDSPTSIPKLLVKNIFLLPIFSTNNPAVKAIPKLKICKMPLIKVLVPAASIPTVSRMMLM